MFGLNEKTKCATGFSFITVSGNITSCTNTHIMFFFSAVTASLESFRENSCGYTHTHPFNGPLSGTTQVSRYQKGKTNLDFTGARESEWQWYQLGHMQVCTSLQTDNHANTSLLLWIHEEYIYRLDVFCQINSTEALIQTGEHHLLYWPQALFD